MNAYFSRFITDDEPAAKPLTIGLPKAMPIGQLFALYDALRVLHDMALGYADNRRFVADHGGLSQAGSFVDDLGSLIGKASDRVAQIAEAASPGDDIEFDMRAEIMIRHAMSCNGAASAASLAAQLHGKAGEAA